MGMAFSKIYTNSRLSSTQFHQATLKFQPNVIVYSEVLWLPLKSDLKKLIGTYRHLFQAKYQLFFKINRIFYAKLYLDRSLDYAPPLA